MEKRDLLVIGGGPAGAAAAIRAARAGVNVTVFEKGSRGRDKVCGDGLTPRAVAALHELEIDMDDADMRATLDAAGVKVEQADSPEQVREKFKRFQSSYTAAAKKARVSKE